LHWYYAEEEAIYNLDIENKKALKAISIDYLKNGQWITPDSPKSVPVA